VGNILDFHRLEDVWTSKIARELQQDIDSKKFTYCAVRHCGVVNYDIDFPLYQIGVNVDESCNLACPSCRTSMINHTSGQVFDLRKNYIDHLVKLVNNFDNPLKLIMSGNGDPLASLIMRPLVLNWQPKSNQTIKLFTNGLLMKKLLPDSNILSHIKEFQISVDAGTADVYKIVRQPGNFSVLQENLNWLSQNRKGARVDLQFCLQSANAHDVVNFVDMCEHYGFNGNIVKLDNWHTFDNFESQDVVDNKHHPLHSTAMHELSKVKGRKNIYINSYLLDLL
jgi:MoaA/NifB/PqqE/SkfB family radical SAM enzyme